MRQADGIHLWDLVAVLVAKDLKLRYRGTVLGVLWSLASPLAFTLVLYVAVRRVFQVQIDDYPLFLLAALFPWQWFSNSVNSASLLFVGNASLIKKVRFPHAALCAATVLAELAHFLVTLPLFAGLVWVSTGSPPRAVWLVGVPLLIAIQAALTLALVLAIATLNAFLRDLEQLVRVLLLLLFYVTPILFPLSMIPESLRWISFVNPVAPIIVSWRALLTANALSPHAALAALHALAALAIAWAVYRRMHWRVPEAV